jgi:ABC-type sulfate transport system substrate-binding protein
VAQATNPIVADRSYTSVGTTATTIDSWYINTYRAAKYTYVAKTTTGNNYETGDLHVVHDNLEGFYSSTFVSKTGSSMITWTLTNDPIGVMNIKAQGTHADVQVKFHAIYLTDPTV